MKDMLIVKIEGQTTKYVACSTNAKTLNRTKELLIQVLHDASSKLISEMRSNDKEAAKASTEQQANLAEINVLLAEGHASNFTKMSDIMIANSIDELKLMGYNIETVQLINY